MTAQSASQRLNLLTAGCSSGEEAYSLAIVARESLPDPSWRVSIRAVDTNPAMIDKARRARYSAWSLRETPPDIRARWFKAEDKGFLVDEGIRLAVDFEERNLAENHADLWRPQFYDIVFCRNLLMYFTPEHARALVDRIAGALAPGGYLFLGHAETLRGLSQDFHLEHTHGTFYYRRRAARDLGAELAAEGRVDLDVSIPVGWPAVEGADSWVEAIGRAAHRIQALTETTPNSLIPSAGRSERRAWDLGRSLELLEQERFQEALDLVGALPGEAARDSGVLLLRAALLTHSGQFGRAEATCRELLRLDEFNSGAHYLLALCREGSGDHNAAREEDQIAVYLDQQFAMPRLHLGLLARRAGDSAAACAEFQQALALLQREDASRLLLFGGGFGRTALMALCRAELQACGGAP
jgi:chemotaxis protein methyltransferase CheR